MADGKSITTTAPAPATAPAPTTAAPPTAAPEDRPALAAPDPNALAAFGGPNGAPVGPRTVAAFLVAHGREAATDKSVRRIMRDRAQAIIGRPWPDRSHGRGVDHRYRPTTAARIVAVALSGGDEGGAL